MISIINPPPLPPEAIERASKAASALVCDGRDLHLPVGFKTVVLAVKKRSNTLPLGCSSLKDRFFFHDGWGLGGGDSAP